MYPNWKPAKRNLDRRTRIAHCTCCNRQIPQFQTLLQTAQTHFAHSCRTSVVFSALSGISSPGYTLLHYTWPAWGKHAGNYLINFSHRSFPFFLSELYITNFTFISILVALTGLFGLAFAHFVVLPCKNGGGKPGKAQPKQPDQGSSSSTTKKTFHSCSTHGCHQNIPGQDACGQCFTCLTPYHDMNTCGSCLTSSPHFWHRVLKHSTILSHISALSSCMNKVDGVLVGCHPLVARWVLGDRAQNPPRRSLIPRWNLICGSGGTHWKAVWAFASSHAPGFDA